MGGIIVRAEPDGATVTSGERVAMASLGLCFTSFLMLSMAGLLAFGTVTAGCMQHERTVMQNESASASQSLKIKPLGSMERVQGAQAWEQRAIRHVVWTVSRVSAPAAAWAG